MKYQAKHTQGRFPVADLLSAGSRDVAVAGETDGPAAVATMVMPRYVEPEIGLPDEAEQVTPALGRAMGKGLAWSLLNNVIGRLGNFLTGIVIVRILNPDQYGTYAVGLVVLTVLLSMNELGISVAVVQRKGSVDAIAPTVATMAFLSSAILATAAFVAAPHVAALLDAPAATGLIRLLLIGVLIDGAVAVPNALITREFMQQTRLKIDTVAFLIGTPVTIVLALRGYGAWSLGWGAVIGNVISGSMALWLAPRRYKPGWNRAVARELLHFGLPLAGASLLLFLMLNVDYVVVGHELGSVQLGFYLLAFNLCSWPITVITTAIRRVTLAAFSRMREDPDAGRQGFERTVGVVMALTLPMCVLLAGYAEPVVSFLYGNEWIPAANAVRLLAVLSFGRIAAELTYDYLAAAGRTRSNLWLQGIWLVFLIPVLAVAAHWRGITGVAAGHAVVVAVVVVPMLGFLLHRAGVSLLGLIRTSLPAIVGAALIGLTVLPVRHLLSSTIAQLFVGTAIGLLVYGVAVLPMRHAARALWNMPGA